MMSEATGRALDLLFMIGIPCIYSYAWAYFHQERKIEDLNRTIAWYHDRLSLFAELPKKPTVIKK